MRYRYTRLNQDGTKTEIGLFDEEKKFTGQGGLYQLLGDVQTIELIPEAYYAGQHQINIEIDSHITAIFGDEEGRYNSENHRNPWFAVFNTPDGIFDVVGNAIVLEELN